MTTPSDLPIAPLLTASEVAAILRVSAATVYAQALAGTLGCVRLGESGGAVRFTREHVEEYLSRGGRPPRCRSCNRPVNGDGTIIPLTSTSKWRRQA